MVEIIVQIPKKFFQVFAELYGKFGTNEAEITENAVKIGLKVLLIYSKNQKLYFFDGKNYNEVTLDES